MSTFQSRANPLQLGDRNRQRANSQDRPNGPYEYQDEYIDPRESSRSEGYPGRQEYGPRRPYSGRNYIRGVHEESDFSFGSDYIQDEREFRPSRMSHLSGSRSWVNVGDSAFSGDTGGHPYTSSEYDENPVYREEHESGGIRRSFAGIGPAGYKRSDERILEDIHERLTWDHHIDASGIAVEVQEGDVVLKGTVRDRDSKRRAELIAEGCAGVGDVQNQLRIGSGEPR